MVNGRHLVWRIALMAALCCAACSLDGSMEELREKVYKERMAHLIKVPGDTLDAKLTWLQNNAEGTSAYLLELSAGESMGPRDLAYIRGRENNDIRITITGGSSECIISLAPDAKGSLLTVRGNITLILGHNITLQGHGNNNAPLVNVMYGALEMVDNAKITGNTSQTNGGGVYVGSSCSFTMTGSASVSNNTVIASYSNGEYRANGGGVYVGSRTYNDSNGATTYNDGTFIMSGSSSVSNNTVTATATGPSYSFRSYGGGVYCIGTFTMSGSASVSNNTASATNSSYGGGVFSHGIFTMSESASVFNNTATTTNAIYYAYGYAWGGGVYSEGAVTLRDSVVISGNTAEANNEGYYSGGGRGGGVSAASGFKMEGGIIYGADAAEGLKNTAGNSSAALEAINSGQYGVFNGDIFNKNGDLTTTDSTIHIVKGVKQ